MDVTKNLVFYFYGFNGYKDNRAIQIHLKCLKFYSHIFDEALFIISVDNINDIELILDIKKSLLECGFKNIAFKVEKNTPYCESLPFYTYIVEKLDTHNGLTMFGHTKGVTNYYNYNSDVIDDWLIGLYYLNLDRIDDIEMQMVYHNKRFFGAFFSFFDRGFNYNNYNYSGTFYWINCQLLNDSIKTGEFKRPSKIYGRSYAESFPGYFFDTDDKQYCYGKYNDVTLFDCDMYKDASVAMQIILCGDTQEYNIFKTSILSNLWSI